MTRKVVCWGRRERDEFDEVINKLQITSYNLISILNKATVLASSFFEIFLSEILRT